MSSLLHLNSKKLLACPTSAEENWTYTDPKTFFLPEAELLHISGTPVVGSQENHFIPWKAIFLEFDNLFLKLSTYLKNIGVPAIVNLLEENKNRLILLDLQGDRLYLSQHPSVHSTLEVRSAPWQSSSFLPNSPIGEALADRLHASSPHKLHLDLKTKGTEHPLILLCQHRDPTYAQSYTCLEFLLEAQSRADLVVLDGGAPFSLCRHNLMLEKHTRLSCLWVATGSPSVTSVPVSQKRFVERRITLQENAKYHEASIFCQGAGTTRFINCVDILDERAKAHLGSVIFAKSGKIDYEPIQIHRAPNGVSHLVLKTILSGKARVSFQGLVRLLSPAQKSEATQDNKNLVLEAGARVDAEPRLEILPHDVICKHGSATGDMDQGQIFYLMTRGFSKVQAQEMVLRGFAMVALAHLPADEALFQIAQVFLEAGLVSFL